MSIDTHAMRRLHAQRNDSTDARILWDTETRNKVIPLLDEVDRLRAEVSELRRDKERLDWLDEYPVNFIELDDFRIIDVRGLSTREAIDAAISTTGTAQTGEEG